MMLPDSPRTAVVRVVCGEKNRGDGVLVPLRRDLYRIRLLRDL